MKASAPAAIHQVREGNQDMRSDVKTGCPAPDPNGNACIAADVCLTGHERTMTFVELGCGEYHLAIERILNAVMSSRMTLPVGDIRQARPETHATQRMRVDAGPGRVRDVIIVGSGPAGYTAAIYAARAGLDTLVVEGRLPGGALMAAGQMDNYPAFLSRADPALPARCAHKHTVSAPSSTPATSTGSIWKVRSNRSRSTRTCVTLPR